MASPRDEAEVAELVRRAGCDGGTLRVVGSGHSFSPLVATEGDLLSLDEWQGVESIDADAQTAWVRAGSKLHSLGEPLARAGLALANMGDIDRQSLAGAIATGTHGTGRTLGCLSTRVEALRVVTAAGELEQWSEASVPFMNAARACLGALGVVTAVKLRLLPPGLWIGSGGLLQRGGEVGGHGRRHRPLVPDLRRDDPGNQQARGVGERDEQKGGGARVPLRQVVRHERPFTPPRGGRERGAGLALP